MIVDIVMPKMGESIMEGTILKWLKNVGDKIERDENLLEISTDKVDTEVPSPESGILVEKLFKENDVVEVGKVIARLETEARTAVTTSAAGEPKEPEKEKTDEKPRTEVKPAEKTEPETEKVTASRFYSPLVMNIAKEEGIPMSELETVKGTGLEGRVTKKDILEYIKGKGKSSVQQQVAAAPQTDTIPRAVAKPAEPPKQKIDYNEEGLSVIEFDNIRQKMAEHMVQSSSVSPHVNAIAECDLSRIDKIRKEMAKEFEEKEGFKLTYMPFIADALVKALKDFPLVNSVIDDSSVPFKAIMRSRVNLGIAVAMDNGGLIVPVIKEADGKNLVGLAREINDLGQRARVKKLTLDEIQGGTITISNYGVFGNIIGTMIINQPQVAILGVGAVKKRPSVTETSEGDFVTIKPIVYLTLSFDHRLVDGALGGKFIMKVVHYLENYTF
ncbi:MAG: 2-oxo acid dehydrogenase subunit E2 [Ignavibacteria bacterium]|nr:2-oxo acid dehydrogenase subunit E2 [Ignavibacteria bacterium]